MNKAVTGYQLVIIITIILGIAFLALAWVFMKSTVSETGNVFEYFVNEFRSKICQSMGTLGQTIGKLFGC
jgi:hypothetical protein